MIFRRGILAAALLALAAAFAPTFAPAAQAAQTYGFDKDHSRVLFTYNHLGLSTQYGRFRTFEGELVFDQAKPEQSKLEVTIEAGSLDTDSGELNNILGGADFFDSAQFPAVTFKSSEIRKTGVGRGQVTGDLTIKDVTRKVILDVTLNFAGPHPLGAFMAAYKGKDYAGFSARGSILRSDFGLGANAPLVSDQVTIIIEAEMVKK